MTDLIQFRPGPTDAELEADRDAKHAKAVTEWLTKHPDLAQGKPMHYCDNEHCGHLASAHDGDRGNCTADVHDFYGIWQCCCTEWEASPDE